MTCTFKKCHSDLKAGSATGGLHPQRPTSMEARDAARGRNLLLQDELALLQEAFSGNETKVRQLVACGADLTITDRDGLTPLHYAAYGGHAAVVVQLLAAGVSADAENKFGMTPLHYAALHSRAAVAEQLLAAGAAVDAKDEDGRTPLYRAAMRGCAAVGEKLLAAGADGAAAADNGSTPRFVAQGAVLAMLVAAQEEAQRSRSIAFAMGLQERLGAASVVRGLDPELLRMVVERVYPPVDDVL